MAIAGGGLSIIQKLYSELDDDFKSVLENDLHAQSMYELLKLPNAHVISPFILAVLHHYDEDEQCFRFGEKILTITLEDVLYITGLPIFGKPVIYDGSHKKDVFLHIFPSITSSYLKRQNRISMDELRGIAKNTNIDEVQRKRAVLLTLAYNIITPSSDGHGIPPNLAPFFDDVEDVDNYAWGASLLSVLYSSLKKYKEKGVKKLDGNLWVVLAFFLIRIPMLANTLNVKLALTNCKNVPLLHHIVERVRPVSFNHKLNHKRFEEILEELINEPTDLPDSESKIIWKPYVPEMLPPRLQGQEIHVTLMAPMFYNGCVLRHEPEKCPRQLDINPSLIIPKRKKIKQTKQKGDHARDLKAKYKRQLEEWNAHELAGAVTAATTSADILGTSSPPHASSSGAKMPARDINNVLITYKRKKKRNISQDGTSSPPHASSSGAKLQMPARDINTVLITYKRKKKRNVSQDAPEYVMVGDDEKLTPSALRDQQKKLGKKKVSDLYHMTHNEVVEEMNKLPHDHLVLDKLNLSKSCFVELLGENKVSNFTFDVCCRMFNSEHKGKIKRHIFSPFQSCMIYNEQREFLSSKPILEEGKKAELLIFPLLTEDHWFGIAIDSRNKKATVLDSFESYLNASVANIFFNNLKKALGMYHKDASEIVELSKGNLKQQENEVDCGVYLLQYIEQWGTRDNITLDNGYRFSLLKRLCKYEEKLNREKGVKGAKTAKSLQSFTNELGITSDLPPRIRKKPKRYSPMCSEM